MAYIAAAAGFPTPTVFNSFGSKNGILIALITEGTAVTRESDRALHSRDGADLAELITGLYVRVSVHAPEIAGKRAWRYAEGAAIRHPDVDLSLQFAIVARGATLLPGRVDPHQHLLSAAYGQTLLQLADIRGFDAMQAAVCAFAAAKPQIRLQFSEGRLAFWSSISTRFAPTPPP